MEKQLLVLEKIFKDLLNSSFYATDWTFLQGIYFIYIIIKSNHVKVGSTWWEQFSNKKFNNNGWLDAKLKQLTFSRLHKWWTFSIYINWWSGYHSVSEGGTSRIQSSPCCPITDKAWQWYWIIKLINDYNGYCNKVLI